MDDLALDSLNKGHKSALQNMLFKMRGLGQKVWLKKIIVLLSICIVYSAN